MEHRYSRILVQFAGAAIAVSGGSALAQSYPNKPIRMLTATSPGGATDIIARITGTALSQRLGQPVNVENRPGGAFIPGTDAAIKSAPDGYTLLFSSVEGLDILPSAVKIPYDAARDLVALGSITKVDPVICVPGSLNISSVKELIATAKAKPGKLSFASTGPGSLTHMMGELLKLRAGVDILHVPYKSSQAAVVDAVGGRLDLVFTGVAPITQHVKSGAMKVLANMGSARIPTMPDVPTMTESGYPGFEVVSWMGVFAPAGVPGDIVARLGREVQEVSRSAAFAEQMAKFGSDPIVMGPEEFGRYVVAQRAMWKAVAREAKIEMVQ